MNLADMLCYADIRQLKHIAEKYDCPVSNSKHELIQSILSRVHRKDVVQKLLSGLPEEDLRFLNSFLFDPREAFSPEEVLARARESRFESEDAEEDGWNPRDLVSEYRRRGWLFNGIKGENRYLLQFPSDLKEKFSNVLYQKFKESLKTGTNPEVYRDEQDLLAEDTAFFLRWLHQQEEAPLTTAGFLYKRNLQQILSSMAVQEDLPPKAAWRFGYGRRFKEYPERFSLIYDYCYWNGLIEEQGDRLVLTENGRSAVHNGERENTAELYRFWLRLYKGPVHNIQTLVRWIEKLAREWVTVKSLKSILVPFIKPFYYDGAEQILEKRILQMMLHLGLLSLGECRENGPVARMNERGANLIRGIRVGEEETIEIPLESGW